MGLPVRTNLVLGAGHEVCARPWSLPPATYRPGGIVLLGRYCDGDEIDAVERRGGAGGHPSQPGGGRAGGGEAAGFLVEVRSRLDLEGEQESGE